MNSVLRVRLALPEDIGRLVKGYVAEEGYVYCVLIRVVKKKTVERLVRVQGKKKQEFDETKKRVWQKLCEMERCWNLTGGCKVCRCCHGILICSVRECREPAKGGFGGKCSAHGGGKRCSIYACGHCRTENSVYCDVHSCSPKCAVVDCMLPTTHHLYCSKHGGPKLPWRNWDRR